MSDRHPTVGSVGTAPRPAVPNPESASAPLPWEHLFPVLAPAVQNALLNRAAERGGLTPADIPAPSPPAGDHAIACLNADPTALPAFDPVDLTDTERSPAEYRAFATALGCPDLFALDVAAGRDQLHRAADLAVEAARRGERVFLITPTAADADEVLARLAEMCGLPVGRAVAPFENRDRLPAASSARTARAHGDAALADARVKANAAAVDAESRLAAIRNVTALLPSLKSAVEELTRIARPEPECCAGTRDESTCPAEKLAATIAQLDAEAAKLAAERATRDTELTTLRGQLAELTEHGAKSSGLFAKLKGLLHLDAAHKVGDLEAKVQAAEDTIRNLDTEAAHVVAQRTTVEDQRLLAEASCAQATMEEGRRQGEATEARERAEAEVRRIHEALASIGAEAFQPGDSAAVDRAAAQLAGFTEKAEAEALFARGWANDLHAHGPELTRRFLSLIRVTVGPYAAVGKDVLTRPVSDEPGPPFDRLIVTDADRMTEDEFLPVARLASRWILVGDGCEESPRVLGNPRGRPAMFRRLLHTARLESWTIEGASLVARLASAEGALSAEPVADRPEIEVRFGRGPAGDPIVAEVVFPPATPIAEAKAFLARELGEVRIVPWGAIRWTETNDRVSAQWPAAAPPAHDGEWIDLGNGIHEQIFGSGRDVVTAMVAFDTAAGWDRASATEWIAGHAPTPRAASIPRPVLATMTPHPRMTVGAIG